MPEFAPILSWIVGPFHPTQTALLVLMVLDILTRLIVQVLKPRSKNEKTTAVLLKKLLMWLMVVSAHQMDQVLGLEQTVRNGVTYALLGSELLSIVEQMGKAGVPIPPALLRTIRTLKGEAAESHAEKTRV